MTTPSIDTAPNTATPPLTDAQALRWLTQRGSSGLRRWMMLTVVCGMAQALAMMALMACLARVLHDTVMGHSLAAAPSWALGAVPLLVVVRAALGYARENMGLRAGQSARHALRDQLLEAAREGGPLWSAQQSGGALSSLATDQIDAVNGYFSRYLPQMRLASAVPVMIVAVVLPYSWMAALILLGTAPLIPFFMVLVGRSTRIEQTKQMQAMQRLGGTFLDLVRGLPTLRLFDARQRSLDEMTRLGDGFRIHTMKVLRMAFLSSTVLEFFTSVAIALTAVFLGFSLLHYLNFGFYSQAVNLNSALFILLLAPEFYQPLRELGTHYHARAEAVAAALALREVLDSVPHSAQQQEPGPQGVQPIHNHGAARLEFHNITLAYGHGKPVVTQCNLQLAPGDIVALQGPSGSGKSSLLRLAAGIATAQEGAVWVDGVPLSSLDRHAWREHIGWMDQHPPLLASSLAANLRAAQPDADDAALMAALDFAGLRAWAVALPQQLDTPMGEGGRLMSGGQLRRLALARLALRPSRLLLLDEPTASLDDTAEAFVVERLRELAHNRTTLIATHRPAPLVLAGRVLRLEAGVLRHD